MDDPLGGYDDPSDPGFKQWLRGKGGGGGAPPVAPPPASGPGGGYGSFFASPSTAGVPSYTSDPARRRDLYGGIDGFRSWMAPGGSSVPSSTDTVPAMLTPGEFVVNRTAAQQPDIAALLHAINSMGLHMAGGGFVPWGGFGIPRKGSMPPPSPVPSPGPAPAPAPAPETPVNTPGGGNPFTSWDAGRNPNSPLGNDILSILAGFGKSGSFSPEGSQAVRDATQRAALGAADAARARAGTMGELYGADPATVAAYKLQTDLGSQGTAAKAYNDVVSQQALSQDAFGKEQLNSLLAFLYNYWQSQQDFEHGSGRPGGIG